MSALPTEMDLRHATLPAVVDTASARLPEAYEAAKQALAACERIDECKEWSDKMAALASYARQVEDESLVKTAMRIHGRALRRVGELLKEFDARPQNAAKQTVGAHGLFSQREAAAAAGMSEHQQVTAVRVANVPADQFEAAIESDNPPTVTKLAGAGKRPRDLPLGFDYLQGRDPQKFSAAIHTLGAMKLLAQKCLEHTLDFVAAGVGASEAQHARELVARIEEWLGRFVVSIKD